jgi:hypothetical protein
LFPFYFCLFPFYFCLFLFAIPSIPQIFFSGQRTHQRFHSNTAAAAEVHHLQVPSFTIAVKGLLTRFHRSDVSSPSFFLTHMDAIFILSSSSQTQALCSAACINGVYQAFLRFFPAVKSCYDWAASHAVCTPSLTTASRLTAEFA